MNTAIIRTYTGKYIDLLDPKIEDIDPIDIAHGLSQICRFVGQSNFFYSVGDHVLGGLVLGENLSFKTKRQWCLHDASEAYLGDVSRPLKQVLPEYQKIEENFMGVICKRFNETYPFDPRVKELDLEIFDTEKIIVFYPLCGESSKKTKTRLLEKFEEFSLV